MNKVSVFLFAEQDRGMKLDKIGDALSNLSAHVTFAAPTAEIDDGALQPGRVRGWRPSFPTALIPHPGSFLNA